MLCADATLADAMMAEVLSLDDNAIVIDVLGSVWSDVATTLDIILDVVKQTKQDTLIVKLFNCNPYHSLMSDVQIKLKELIDIPRQERIINRIILLANSRTYWLSPSVMNRLTILDVTI